MEKNNKKIKKTKIHVLFIFLEKSDRPEFEINIHHISSTGYHNCTMRIDTYPVCLYFYKLVN